jgi:hypothetical protein
MVVFNRHPSYAWRCKNKMKLNEKYNEIAEICLRLDKRTEEIKQGMLRIGFTEEELWQD